MKQAVSAGHKLGQLIGRFLESCFDDVFSEFAGARNLYCDKKGPRPSVRGNSRKVTWVDSDGNRHDLDYVFETGGSDTRRGEPVGFVELAWRRYTKHSRNKTGEIESALLPLRHRYRTSCRFIGCVVAGEYSEGGIQQLRSHGIIVLHIPFESIASSFDEKGIDIRYPQWATDTKKRQVISYLQSLGAEDVRDIQGAFLSSIDSNLGKFVSALDASISLDVESVRVLSLFGEELNFESVEECVTAISGYARIPKGTLEHHRFEILIKFRGGSKVERAFGTAEEVIVFLNRFSYT